MENVKFFYLIIFFSAFLLAFLLTLLVKKVAIKMDIVDKPYLERKVHKKAVPLLGGTAVFLTFFIILYFVRDKLTAGNLDMHHWIGFFAGACFLILGGFLDDKFNIHPKYQVIFPILAVLSVIAGGVEIEKITNPFGGFLELDNLKVPIIEWGGAMRYFMVISDGLIILWLLGMMYTTKLLDGLDGLVTGVVAIGAFVIFLFTMTTKYYQPDIGLASLALCAVSLGFLLFNWHPAKIFLGEGGSLFLGYALGVLAIISGGKIAVALLVMGIPVLDVVWTIIRRAAGKKNPFTISDRLHLHFRLYDLGLGQKKTVLAYYFMAGVFGLLALFLQSQGKIMALGGLVVLMIVIVALLERAGGRSGKGLTK